jgi:hypothetical protein
VDERDDLDHEVDGAEPGRAAIPVPASSRSVIAVIALFLFAASSHPHLLAGCLICMSRSRLAMPNRSKVGHGARLV